MEFTQQNNPGGADFAPSLPNLRGPRDPSRRKSTRQQLSCNKCKERKVKCDRTQPCSACCARGQPRGCVFDCDGEFTPISQGDEIRKLRKESERLREFIRANNLSLPDGDSGSQRQLRGRAVSHGSKTGTPRLPRYRANERTDNVYFGTPGLVNVVSGFADVRLGQSLTHVIPREMYAPRDGQTAYPFPILAGSTATDMVSRLLGDRNAVFRHLDMFQRRAPTCYLPYMPDGTAKAEFERFLDDAEENAVKHPDMLAVVFATMAAGIQLGVWDACGGRWEADAVQQARVQGDVYLAAAAQALRLGSFMNSPTLLAVQALVTIGPYLTNSGRFLDAWTMFGTTIRAAQSIGLHRDPRLLFPVPDLRESMIRRTLWWWILHMDQQYSVTLGRPLGISGIGDCPPPEVLVVNPAQLRLSEFIHHFTILARQILASDGLLNIAKIDEFTDKLVALWETMPETLKFNESWLRGETALPEWPLEIMSATLFAKVHSFVILLNRQRSEIIPEDRPQDARNQIRSELGGLVNMEPAEVFERIQSVRRQPPMRGRRLVIESSKNIIWTLLFLHERNPAGLICWTIGQQAFNACMILLLDSCETGDTIHEWLILRAYAVFDNLHRSGVHKLAEVAVRRIRQGLMQLQATQEQIGDDVAASAAAAPLHVPSGLYHESIMGHSGVFLLEGCGAQSHEPPSFWPLGDHAIDNSSHLGTTQPPIVSAAPAIVPVSDVNPTPFPFMPSVALPSDQATPPTHRFGTPELTSPWSGPPRAVEHLHHSDVTPRAFGSLADSDAPIEAEVLADPLRIRDLRRNYETRPSSRGLRVAQGDGPRGVQRPERLPRKRPRQSPP